MPIQLSFEKVDKYYQKILAKNRKLERYANISFASFSYILEIKSIGNPTISELATSMDVTKPSASSMINKLVDMGFVEKHSDEDRRVCRLSLSTEGSKMVELGLSADKMFFDKIEEILDEDEFATFTNLWLKITSDLNEDPRK